MAQQNQLVRLPPGYTYEGFLGGGGMGEVYLARQTRLGRLVAVKTPRLEGGTGAEMDRLKEEARVIALLDHPNIIRVHDCIVWNTKIYIIMEFLDGITLDLLLDPSVRETVDKSFRRYLAPDNTLQFEFIARVGQKTADALEYAHGKTIYHRDIKPSNIFLTRRGEIKLFDFSIARDVTTQGVTNTGHLIGSPPYMSPEQIKGAKVDSRSDIYSLGCVLFHSVTGRFPYNDTSEIMICLQHLQAEIPDPREFAPSVPPKLREIILRCLEKEKEDRYSSSRELHEAFVSLLADSASLARADSVNAPDPVAKPSALSHPGDQPEAITTDEPHGEGEPELDKPSPQPKRGMATETPLLVAVALLVMLVAYFAAAYHFEQVPGHEGSQNLVAIIVPPSPPDPPPPVPPTPPPVAPADLPPAPVLEPTPTSTPVPTATPTPTPMPIERDVVDELREWYNEGLLKGRRAHDLAWLLAAEDLEFNEGQVHVQFRNTSERSLEVSWAVRNGYRAEFVGLDHMQHRHWKFETRTFESQGEITGGGFREGGDPIIIPRDEATSITIPVNPRLVDGEGFTLDEWIPLSGDLVLRGFVLAVLNAEPDTEYEYRDAELASNRSTEAHDDGTTRPMVADSTPIRWVERAGNNDRFLAEHAYYREEIATSIDRFEQDQGGALRERFMRTVNATKLSEPRHDGKNQLGETAFAKNLHRFLDTYRAASSSGRIAPSGAASVRGPVISVNPRGGVTLRFEYLRTSSGRDVRRLRFHTFIFDGAQEAEISLIREHKKLTRSLSGYHKSKDEHVVGARVDVSMDIAPIFFHKVQFLHNKSVDVGVNAMIFAEEVADMKRVDTDPVGHRGFDHIYVLPYLRNQR